MRIGNLSLSFAFVASVALSLLAIQLAECRLVANLPTMRRSCLSAPSAVACSGPMQLRGGIEYYENRMDVQEAITALKQAIFESINRDSNNENATHILLLRIVTRILENRSCDLGFNVVVLKIYMSNPNLTVSAS